MDLRQGCLVESEASESSAAKEGANPTGRRLWRPFRHLSRGRLLRLYTESVAPEFIAIVCFLVLLWVAIIVAISHEYRSAVEAAAQATTNLARAFEESTRR